MSENNRSIRIKTNVDDPTEKYINLKLTQDFEKIEILSLNLKQTDIYRSFNANYGCIVGRVQSNGVGLPNCKVSVFIPVEDIELPEILAIYPFKSPNDTLPNGKRYNLLNNLKRLNPFSGFKFNNFGFGFKPKTPIGSIPDKSELISNNTWIEVYKKYYKFSTITNSSGDYMLMGVPVGNQQLHMDCDITDIGKFSTSIPILSQVNSLPASLFNEDGTKLTQTTDLNTIPTLQSQNISINVVPFWGDNQETEIGITRADFNVNAKIIPSTTILGAGFTQAEEGFWGDRVVFRFIGGVKNLCFRILRININIKNIIPFFKVTPPGFDSCVINGGIFAQEPFSFKWIGKTSTCDDPVDSGDNFEDFTNLLNLDSCRVGTINEKIFSYNPNVNDQQINTFNTDINNDITKLQKNQYAKILSDNGTFLYQIPCNRRRVITNEFGEEIVVDDPNLGLPTEFFGYIIFTMDELPMKSSGGKVNVDRVKIKVPQCTDYDSDRWVKTAYKFESNNIYTVSQFFGVANNNSVDKSTGIVLDVTTLGQNDENLYGEDLEMLPNSQISLFGGRKISRIFTNEWLNGCLFFYQVAHRRRRGRRRNDEACRLFLGSGIPRTRTNNEPLGGGEIDNYYILNGQRYPTNFVELIKDDLTDVIAPNNKRGLFINDTQNNYMSTINLTSKFFYKGLYTNSNSINNLINKDII